MPNSDALLAAGASGAIAAGNALATANLNRKNRKFAQEMYDKQKADNLAFWNLQNQYNSPAAQMQRFRDAGLNPNLIYGQQNTAGSVQSADFKQPSTDVPRVGDIGSSVLTYLDATYNFEMKQAQTDNLKAQNAVILQEAALKAAQIEATKTGTSRALFDLDLESELRQTSVDARREALRQMKTLTDVSIRRDVREALMNSSNLREANERIQNLIQERAYKQVQSAHTDADRKRILAETARIKKSIDLMMKEGVIKDLDVDLSKAGVRASDPIWYRSLGLIVNSVLDYFK